MLLESLASSLDAGLTPEQALAPYSTPAARAARERLGKGEAVHAALAAAGLLEPTEAAIIRAAERAGGVPGALLEVAGDLGSATKQWSVLGAALGYPVFLCAFATVILPLPTLLTDGVGAYLSTALPPLLVTGAVVGVVAWLVLVRRVPIATFLAPTRPLPVFKTLHMHIASARICRALGRLIAAGLPMDEALAAARDSLPYADQRAAMDRTRSQVKSGSVLAEALTSAGILPPETLAAVAAGEASGRLDGTLAQRAESHQQAAAKTAKIIGAAVSTMVTLAVMGMLAYAIVGQYLALLPGFGGEGLPPELREIMR